jgi:hypothetical protein
MNQRLAFHQAFDLTAMDAICAQADQLHSTFLPQLCRNTSREELRVAVATVVGLLETVNRWPPPLSQQTVNRTTAALVKLMKVLQALLAEVREPGNGKTYAVA